MNSAQDNAKISPDSFKDLMKEPRILVVEDDSDINAMLCDLLTTKGFQVQSAFSGTEGILLFDFYSFDLILLDLMLPGKTGAEVLQSIRKTSNCPILILTAVTDKSSVVDLLEQGANDYIVKPFDNGELIARIKVWLSSSLIPQKNTENMEPEQFLSDRPLNYPDQTEVRYKNLILSLERYEAYIQGVSVGLSKKEFDILFLLVSNPTKVFTKKNLYQSVWQDTFWGDDNTINVHISKIRGKLNQIDSSTEYIKTVWGIGFKMVED